MDDHGALSIVAVDTDQIGAGGGRVRVPFVLSQEPNEPWRAAFTSDPERRAHRLSVEGSKLSVDAQDIDQIEMLLETVRTAVSRANDLYAKSLRDEADQRAAMLDAGAKREAAVQGLKDQARNLEF